MGYESQREKPVFNLVSAHYHGPWAWNYVREELARQGYDSIAPDLPIEDPEATLDDHAKIIREAEEEKGAEQYIRVGWSWGGDVVYRQLGYTTVSKLVFLAAPLRRITAGFTIPNESPIVNGRTLLYHVWIKAEEQGVAEFDPVLIGNAFYNDLKDEALQALAIGQLRPHPHITQDDIAVLPDMDTHYVWFKKDRAFRPESQVATADMLGISKTGLETDHAPMLSRPQLLGSHLIALANRKPGDSSSLKHLPLSVV
jgi:pimeloyl-ACP methyl ester carboxylesterase